MKKNFVFLMITAVLLCFVLASCGMDNNGGNTGTSSTTNDDRTETYYNDETRDDIFDTTREDGTFMESLSEVISEGMSDNSILDPQNGIVSDTQEAMD